MSQNRFAKSDRFGGMDDSDVTEVGSVKRVQK